MYALNIEKETERILSACKILPSGKYDDMPIVDYLPEGDITDYLYCLIEDLDTGDIIGWEYVYSPKPIPEPTAEQQIAELKAQLSATDYKIIKCSEAQLVGEELPYDIVTLHA
jgi:hypothetical protein